MNRNVEIKARVGDVDRLRAAAEQLSASAGQLIEQEDTFFRVPAGRLKLRTFSPSQGELIYYDREDRGGPRQSRYALARTDDPASLRDALSAALGVRGVVRKRRLLYLVGQTRIHLDDVDGLGRFVEIEVVLREGQTAREGESIARELMSRLGVRDEDLIEVAYIDLLEANAPPP